jgi:penicillin-binding protein 1C
MIKTGTSQGYRDNWTVAVTPGYTVGVWAGNFNGEPMLDVSGVAGAAPIAHEIVDYLHQKHSWTGWNDPPQKKKVRICSLSGKKPTKHCAHTRWEFVGDDEKISDCDFHVAENKLSLPQKFIAWQMTTIPETLPRTNDQVAQRHDVAQFKIISPEDGAHYRIDTQRPREGQYLSLKTTPTAQAYTILLDGKKLTHDEARHIELVPGEHHLALVLSQSPEDQWTVLGEVTYWIK